MRPPGISSSEFHTALTQSPPPGSFTLRAASGSLSPHRARCSGSPAKIWAPTQQRPTGLTLRADFLGADDEAGRSARAPFHKRSNAYRPSSSSFSPH